MQEKRAHPLKMETLPRSQDEDKGVDMAALETDDEFRFKRHRNKRLRSVPTLGEQWDHLRDGKQARWIDNFNSSLPNTSRMAADEPELEKSQGCQSQPLPQSPQNLVTPQPLLSTAGANGNPQTQQPIYFYMVPSQQYYSPAVSHNAHSMIEYQRSQYGDGSTMFMAPNTSMQPFNPSQTSAPFLPLGPPPQIFPSNSIHQHQQRLQRTRESRDKIEKKRGNRLSIANAQHDGQLVSPHGDIPEDEFYKHIGNSSFGRELQLKQLFHWSLNRSLHKFEKKEQVANKKTNGNSAYVEPHRIALDILKSFIGDLKKEENLINWEAEEIVEDQENLQNEENHEDTELMELFAEDLSIRDLPSIETESLSSSNTRKKIWKSKYPFNDEKMIKLPNIKNLKNAESLKILTDKVERLNNEVSAWSRVLDNQKIDQEWSDYNVQIANQTRQKLELSKTIDFYTTMRDDLQIRIDDLMYRSHFLQTAQQCLNNAIKIRLKSLSGKINSTNSTISTEVHGNVRPLLRGLSEVLSQKCADDNKNNENNLS